MAVRLRNGVSTRKPVGRIGYNGNGTRNGTSEDPVTKKKTTKKTASKDTVIEEPVTLKVTRTVKKKFVEQAQEIRHTTDQENPGDPKDEDEDIDLENVEVRRFLVEPAKVNYHYTVSRNQHFQSVSVGCSVTIPCYREEIEEAMCEAKSLVSNRLKMEIKKADDVLSYLVKKRFEADQAAANEGRY